MGAADHAGPTHTVRAPVTDGVIRSADSSTGQRTSPPATSTAESAQTPLRIGDVPAALSALLSHARWERGPEMPRTAGPMHVLRCERVTVLEAALLLAGAEYDSAAWRCRSESEAAALWTRVARAVAVDLEDDVRRIDRMRVAFGKIADARVRAWDGVVTLATALYEEIGGRS